ncbi:MAG: GrpB family protein [Actinomycetota bacterium]
MDPPPERDGHEPMTDEQIHAATVGERQVHGGPIKLADYDPSWPGRFALQAERIAVALGERAISIEHVGSTAVPGLPAKPTIDVLLVVANSADEETYVPALEAAGFELRIREPDLDEHRMFRDLDANVHVHVLSDGCPEIERCLLFRDRLRVNRADRVLYERTKRELAQREWRYVQNYADAKGDVIEAVIARALGDAPG